MHSRRKVTPSVRDGQVRKKNDPRLSPFWNSDQSTVTIRRERPGRGYRHVVRRKDLRRFLTLVDDWAALSGGLRGILLTHDDDVYGWYCHGVIALCAWSRDFTVIWDSDFYQDHRNTLSRLAVPVTQIADGVQCEFTDWSAQAFMLLHIFMHELGHHRDRMTTKSTRASARGENYAEGYAVAGEAQLWARYCREFPTG